jgi:hypothetical protein
MGLDCSTQGLKATVVDASLRVVASQALNYQAEFGRPASPGASGGAGGEGGEKWALTNGVVVGTGGAVTQPTAMVRLLGERGGGGGGERGCVGNAAVNPPPHFGEPTRSLWRRLTACWAA